MAAQLRQSMNLTQTLRITPQLQQAIKLLQLSRMELETEIRKELEENPMLEEAQEIKEEDLLRTKDAAVEVETPSANDQDPQKQDEFDWENYLESNTKPTNQNLSGGNDEIMNYENVISATTTLHDHLLWQARMSGVSEEDIFNAEVIINYLNDDGYLSASLEQILEDEKSEDRKDERTAHLTLDLLEEALLFVQEFDPPGIGARDLRECLILQAKALEEDTKDLVYLINNHLKDLEKRNFEGIAKAMNKDIEEIQALNAIISAMDPKPGRVFSPSDTHYVMPDVYVYKVGDDYLVSLNEDGLPRLKISNFYKNMLTTAGKGNQTSNFIQDRLRSAVWLIKSIHQRQRTIFRVAESIVKRQREFLDKGQAFIKPMVLKDVANDIGMHESTVSRVTTSKYIHTAQGIFELKYFFNSGIATSDGESLASESVKLKIRNLVSQENPEDPLSDQKIVDLLRKEGVLIARRTVAKYRDLLKIQPSSRRKKV